jgi:hypothetical protein
MRISTHGTWLRDSRGPKRGDHSIRPIDTQGPKWGDHGICSIDSRGPEWGDHSIGLTESEGPEGVDCSVRPVDSGGSLGGVGRALSQSIRENPSGVRIPLGGQRPGKLRGGTAVKKIDGAALPETLLICPKSIGS